MRPRKIDYDECRELRAADPKHWTYQRLAARYGVSSRGVDLALHPERMAKVAARNAAWQRAGTCPDCGKPATRIAGRGQSRCPVCAARAQAKVRDGTAYCPTCDTWKPLAEFARASRHPARGVHGECRPCSTKRRTANRHANIERDRARDREYKRRKGQKVAA